MRPTIRKEINRIVGAYDLHSCVPVQLDPLEDLFIVRFTDMEQIGAVGAILIPPNGWPVSTDNRARILLDHHLNDQEARVALAHEIGHGMYQHPGNLTSLAFGLENKHELQAWKAAALLLIPPGVVREEQTVERVAAVCMVPEWLVEIWQSTNG